MRNREALLLATTESIAALAHDGGVAVWQRRDGVVNARGAAGFVELGRCGVWFGVSEVRFDGLVKEVRVL